MPPGDGGLDVAMLTGLVAAERALLTATDAAASLHSFQEGLDRNGFALSRGGSRIRRVHRVHRLGRGW